MKNISGIATIAVVCLMSSAVFCMRDNFMDELVLAYNIAGVDPDHDFSDSTVSNERAASQPETNDCNQTAFWSKYDRRGLPPRMISYNRARKIAGVDPDHDFSDSTVFHDLRVFNEQAAPQPEIKQILSLLPAELATIISGKKYTYHAKYHSQHLLTAFFCVNQSLSHKQRNAVCGSYYGLLAPSPTSSKWIFEVEYHAHKLLEEKENPFKQAEIIEQTVAALHAYREQTAPRVVVEEVQNIPMDENNPYERKY